MPRHTRREIPLEPHAAAGGSSQFPTCRVSREFAEELGLDPFSTEPPPREEARIGAARDSEVAPRSYAQPTLRPAAVERPPRRAERLGEVALLVAALCIVAGASYTMGRATGRTEGELAVTRAEITALAEAVAPSGEVSAEPEGNAAAPAWPLAAAASAPVAPRAAPVTVAAPTVVEPAVRDPEPDVKPMVAAEAPGDRRVDEPSREERMERRERAEARALRREAARQAAVAERSRAAAAVAPETPAPVANETPIAAATEGPSPAAVVATPELVTTVVTTAEPATATATSEVPAAGPATTAEPPARPARPIPLDPLAGAIDIDSADRIGRMLSPMHADVRELEALPERPSRTEIRSGLHPARRQARDCGHEGTLMVDMVIRPDGHVIGVRVTEGTSDAAVVECVRSALMDARFAPFSGPEFVLHYPIRL